MSDLHEGEKPVEPILAQTFEGSVVTKMEGVLPMVTLDMPEGYPVGTHLRFEIEVRVANVRFEEGKGRHAADFSRKHVLVTEGVQLTAAFIPSELDSATIGSAAGAADLLQDEEEPEQIAEFEELPLDPSLQTPVETPDVVETLDEQISRMAEEEAAAYAAADDEERAAMAKRMGTSVKSLGDQFEAFRLAMTGVGVTMHVDPNKGQATVMTSGYVNPNLVPNPSIPIVNYDTPF